MSKSLEIAINYGFHKHTETLIVNEISAAFDNEQNPRAELASKFVD